MVIGKVAKHRRTGSELNGGEPEEPGQNYLHVGVKQSLFRHFRHRGFWEVEAPRFQDSRHMKVVK